MEEQYPNQLVGRLSGSSLANVTNLTYDDLVKWFHTKPVKDHLMAVRELQLKSERELYGLSQRNVHSMDVKEHVDYDIRVRELHRDINKLQSVYFQLLECYMMSDDDFRAWQHGNRLMVEYIKPFNKALPKGDDFIKERDYAMKEAVAARQRAIQDAEDSLS